MDPKRGLKKYIPSSMIDRPKMGFSVPIEYWLKGELKDWSESLLDPNKLEQQGVFDGSEVRSLWNDFNENGGGSYHEIWSILMFQAWLENEGKSASTKEFIMHFLKKNHYIKIKFLLSYKSSD